MSGTSAPGGAGRGGRTGRAGCGRLGRRRSPARHAGRRRAACRRGKASTPAALGRGDRLIAGDGAVEAGRDDRDPDLALHRGVVAGAEDDLGVLAHGVVDDLVDLGRLTEGQVVAADDVDQDARSRR